MGYSYSQECQGKTDRPQYRVGEAGGRHPVSPAKPKATSRSCVSEHNNVFQRKTFYIRLKWNLPGQAFRVMPKHEYNGPLLPSLSREARPRHLLQPHPEREQAVSQVRSV